MSLESLSENSNSNSTMSRAEEEERLRQFFNPGVPRPATQSPTKAILEFDTCDPEGAMAHKRAVSALDMALALHDIRYELKGDLEQRIESRPTETKGQLLDYIIERVGDILYDRGLIIESLVR